MADEDVARLVERFDHHDPAFSTESTANAVFAGLRAHCPVAHSDAHGGFWAIAGHEEVLAVAQDDVRFPKRFGLSVPGMVPVTTPDELLAKRVRNPSNLDPPEYFKVRKILNPLFSPGKANEWEERAREIIVRLIDDVIVRGACDAVDDLFKPFTGIFTMRLLGFPDAAWDEWGEQIHEALHDIPATGADRASTGGLDRPPTEEELLAQSEALSGLEVMSVMVEAILETVADRRESPVDDLLSHFATTTIDGVPMTDLEILANSTLVTAGGVDTTIGAMTAALLYLGRNPGPRKHLSAEPELIPTAVEEFLRVFAPVTGIGRMAAEDCELAGRTIRRGEPVLMLYPSANRDERAFPNADDIVLDRQPNRHVTFSAGVHRCPGSNFARMEFRIVLEEILRRIPDFTIDESSVEMNPDSSVVRSYAHAPIRFSPGVPSR
jgi:cytochrome P450